MHVTVHDMRSGVPIDVPCAVRGVQMGLGVHLYISA